MKHFEAKHPPNSSHRFPRPRVSWTTRSLSITRLFGGNCQGNVSAWTSWICIWRSYVVMSLHDWYIESYKPWTSLERSTWSYMENKHNTTRIQDLWCSLQEKKQITLCTQAPGEHESTIQQNQKTQQQQQKTNKHKNTAKNKESGPTHKTNNDQNSYFISLHLPKLSLSRASITKFAFRSAGACVGKKRPDSKVHVRLICPVMTSVTWG